MSLQDSTPPHPSPLPPQKAWGERGNPLHSLTPNLLALIAGSLFPLAFAPFHFYLLAVLAPAILLKLWQGSSCMQVILRGWLFGLGMFGVGASWVYVSIHVYGNTAALLAVFFTLLFVCTLALFIAGQGLLFSTLLPANNFMCALVGFPASWILFEWMRSWLFTGFPWLLIAYSQVASPLRGLIPVLGEYGTGFVVLFTSALLLILVQITSKFMQRQTIAKNIWWKLFFSIVVVFLFWIFSGFLNQTEWTKARNKPILTSLIQGDIPQELKWSSSYLQKTLTLYYDLTRQHWNSELIIWPEGAIPLPLPEAQDFVTKLANESKDHHTTLLTGIPVQATNQFQYYNAIVALGEGHGQYYKRYLVPFGEYVPLEKIVGNIFQFLDIPMSNFIAGPVKQPDLVAGKTIIGPFICYEIAYGDALEAVLPGAQLFVTVSDDAWFGDSLAPAQHLQIGQFRALESGRDLLFDTNNGITAIINSLGQVVHSLPQFKIGVLTGFVQPRIGMTPWGMIGNMPFIVVIFLLFAMTWLVNRRERYMINIPKTHLC